MSIGRFLLTVVGLVTSIGCYIADWNETHIYNDSWPPHAKFHNAQTMSLGLLLGLLTLFYTWQPTLLTYFTTTTTPLSKSSITSITPNTTFTSSTISASLTSLTTATLFASLYWITQITSILYPGTSFTDPQHPVPNPPYPSHPRPFSSSSSIFASLPIYLNSRLLQIKSEISSSGLPPQVILFPVLEFMVVIGWSVERRRLLSLLQEEGKEVKGKGKGKIGERKGKEKEGEEQEEEKHVKWKGRE